MLAELKNFKTATIHFFFQFLLFEGKIETKTDNTIIIHTNGRRVSNAYLINKIDYFHTKELVSLVQMNPSKRFNGHCILADAFELVYPIWLKRSIKMETVENVA